jgi:peroxiredoxin
VRSLLASVVLGIAFALPVSLALGGDDPQLRVGDPAPAFKAKAHTGKTVSLDDFAGKRVILWFYPKADTGG